jgi:DNA-binding transcriptional ArsR family regulator
LDALHGHDGLAVGDLCAVLPEMTRFGAMKHLGLLEDAHLIVTERVGRSKLHYLNPVPIQRIYDRWISKYAAMSATALTALSTALESPLDSNQHPEVTT